MVYCPVALRRQPDDPCRMPPRSPLEAAIRREIGADRLVATRSTRVERQLHAVAEAFAAVSGRREHPRVSLLLCASVREADPGPKRGQMAGYRGGICADLAHEGGHMRLFSRLPGGRPGATLGANGAKQQ